MSRLQCSWWVLLFASLQVLIKRPATSEVLVLSLAATPLEHFHVEENLSDIPLGRLEGQQSKTVEIPICFVAEGQFEFVAEVHILGQQSRAGEGELKVVVRES
jgi:trafficking protein particle complex subunit 9